MVHAYKSGPQLYIADDLPLPSIGRAPNTHRQRRVHLYVAEEQEIFRGIYASFFSDLAEIEVVHVSKDTSADGLVEEIIALRPDVALVGVKVLRPAVVEQLEAIRQACPDVALVLLSAIYDAHGLRALREFARSTSRGCAYLLKHTVDTPSQLAQVITGVNEGRIILDPVVMEGLITVMEPQAGLLQQLSPREREVLGLMAKGYRNSAVAEMLGLEVKTIDRHINSIYSKLDEGPDAKHPRVAAVTLYMRATGQLLPEKLVGAPV